MCIDKSGRNIFRYQYVKQKYGNDNTSMMEWLK